MHDTFLDSTVDAWRSGGLPKGVDPQDFFGLDLEMHSIDHILKSNNPPVSNNERFTLLEFSEPFQRLCDIYGREDAMRRLALFPKDFSRELSHEMEKTLEALSRALDKGFRFDGAWVWGDMAHKAGLFISPSWYRQHLLPIHREIFDLLSRKGLFIFFHSDGNIKDIIPSLVDLGVRALHPLEENSGMDVDSITKDYKRDLVFMGNVDIQGMLKEGSFDRLREKIGRLKESGSYIYTADYPIFNDISFRDYSRALDVVRESGAY